MTPTAVERVIGLIDDADPYGQPPEEIAALQLAAANERLVERRSELTVLDRRATDVGLDRIEGFDDLVPLLFSHTTYKSYPDSFVRNGRWNRLLAWYDTLAVGAMDDVDLAGVTSLDEWIDALWAAGHRAHSSSGTSGKCSFIPSGAVEADRSSRIRLKNLELQTGITAAQQYRWYQLAPTSGRNRAIDVWNALGDALARPGERHYLINRPMLQSEVTRAATIRQQLAAGTLSPSELSQFERDAAERREELDASMTALVRDLIEHRSEPVAVAGLWPQHWMLVQRAKEMGIEGPLLHPDAVVFGAGGTKGTAMPPDYRDQIFAYYGAQHHPDNYGMTELSSAFPKCPSGAYHQPPWVKLLVLDQSGEHLLDTASGAVEGRAAFFDIASAHRWGGIISGDRVTADYGRCACGRPGPTVRDSVARYSELEGGDDKLSCAGTMEAYVRGVVEV